MELKLTIMQMLCIQSEVGVGVTIGNMAEIGAGVFVPPESDIVDSMVVFRNGMHGEQDAGIGHRSMEVTSKCHPSLLSHLPTPLQEL
jgi:hypothetical protein